MLATMAETGENFDQPRALTGPAENPAQLLSVNRGQIRHRQQINKSGSQVSKNGDEAI
jgi:hypothetical protein